MTTVSVGDAGAEPVGTVIGYEQTATAVLPPAAAFAGSAGGDGWALAFDDVNAYNVFHHGALKYACHAKATAAACTGNGYSGATKTVTQVVGSTTYRFHTGMTPPVYVDKANQRMFTVAVRSSSFTAPGTAGVVEIDLASTNANPFVAWYPLSRDGEGPCYNNTNNNCATATASAIMSNTTLIGTKWYFYNYTNNVANPALPDSRNKLLCFNLATKAACGDQPYDVQTSGGVQGRKWEVGNIGTVDNKIFVTIFNNTNTGALAEISCVDVSSTPANCSGWPKAPAATVGSKAIAAPPFPLLNTSGSPVGVCFVGDPNVCTDFSGSVQTIPSALANLSNPEYSSLTYPANYAYATARSEAHFHGTRMYLQNVGPPTDTTASVNTVSCYDFATEALCSGFPTPKSFVTSELSGLYSIQSDPTYPNCIWVNSNAGTKQIQNFDYKTGGVCGAEGSLLPISNFLENHSMCEVKEWKTFTLVKPGAGEWTSGTVEFDDANGDPISGVTTQNIGSDGTIDLEPLALQTHSDFAKVRVKLVGAETPTIDVKMKWTAEWHPECALSGQTALTTTTTPGPTTTGPDSSSTTAPGSSSNGSDSTTTTDPGVSSTGEAPEDLTTSGKNSAPLTLIAIGVVVLGAGLGVLSRRRRSN